MIWRILGSVFALFWVLNGLQMFGCDAISFTGSGSRRLVQWGCSDTGVPGPLAGLGIIGIAALLLWVWWSPYFENKASTGTGRARGAGQASESISARPPVALKVGDRIRVRGQMKGRFYTIVDKYVQEPVQGEWVYIRDLESGFEIGTRARPVASDSILQVETDYYYVRGFDGLGNDGAVLQLIGSWQHDTLGLPRLEQRPPRPPDANERRMMDTAADQAAEAAEEAEQLERYAKKREAWRLNARCYECGRANSRIQKPNGEEGWFLKYQHDDGERWSCPEGKHQVTPE